MDYWKDKSREKLAEHLKADHKLSVVKGSHKDLLQLHLAIHRGEYREPGIVRRPRNRELLMVKQP